MIEELPADGLPVGPQMAYRYGMAAEELCTDGGHIAPYRILCLDAAAFGLAPQPLAALLDEVEVARGASAPPLRRDLPYAKWRSLVTAAGPPAVLALAMLPPEGSGGALRLPSGARRRLRDVKRLEKQGRVG